MARGACALCLLAGLLLRIDQAHAAAAPALRGTSPPEAPAAEGSSADVVPPLAQAAAAPAAPDVAAAAGETEEASEAEAEAAWAKKVFGNGSATTSATSFVQANEEEAGSLGWRSTQQSVGTGWCRAEVPTEEWALPVCGSLDRAPLEIKVLTYNLFWWNLFGRRGGAGGSAGKLIAAAGRPQQHDLLGFQECEQVSRVLEDGGLSKEFTAIQGPYALALAFRTSAFELLASGVRDVGEDAGWPRYGHRAGQWVRLRHRDTGATVFFLNHHGPLPLHSGGLCGGDATAYNLLRVIGMNANITDAIIVVGDFNARTEAPTVSRLSGRLHRAFSGQKFGGIDHVFTSCGPTSVVSTTNLGSGGSDHDALNVVLQV